MARLTILPVSAPVVVAPAGVWFEAVDVSGFMASAGPGPNQIYDPSFHEITYVWTVNSEPLPAFTAPKNMIPAWNNPNRAYGKQVALFFPKPGRYEILLTARDRAGTEGTAQYTLDVADPDQIYPGADTLCVSFNGAETWAGSKSGCQKITSAQNLAKALQQAKQPLRVLFRRGQNFPLDTLRIEHNQLGQIDSWGEGSMPILRTLPGQFRSLFQFGKRTQITQFAAANIAFRGDWDTTTETGLNTSSPLAWTSVPTPCHYTLWGCHFDGFNYINLQVKKELSSTILVGNSTVTNWRDYGFFMRSESARFALSGMCVAQHPYALHGGGKSGALSNNHGPVRIPECAKVYIGTSDFFSRSGWSSLAGELADQPCLRLNTKGKRNNVYNLDRVVCEGGLNMIHMEGANTRVQDNPGNYLIDKATLIGTAKTIGPFVAFDFGGLTARNIVGILPDTPRRHPNRWQGALRTKMDNPGPGNAETPIATYSATFLNLLSRDNDRGKPWITHTGGDAFLNATLENILLHDGPRQDSGLDLSRALPGITPRFKGIRYNFKPVEGDLADTVAPGRQVILPYVQVTEDKPGTEGTPATSLRYWQTTENTDRRHMLWVQGLRGMFLAERGDFQVQFTSQGVVLTNTSKQAWKAGSKFALRLDRTSRLPPLDRRYASPDTLPMPLPGDRHQSKGGLVAEDDFFGRPRGATPSQGAVEPL